MLNKTGRLYCFAESEDLNRASNIVKLSGNIATKWDKLARPQNASIFKEHLRSVSCLLFAFEQTQTDHRY